MKKYLKILNILLLMFCCSFILIACDEDTNTKFGEKDPETGIRFGLRYGSEYTVVGYDGKAATVTIPVYYKGLPVTEISDGAYMSIDGGGYTGFAKNKRITSLKFESGSLVRRIGSYAFVDCVKLVNVELPPSVVEVDQDAFSNTGIWRNASSDSIIYVDDWVIGYKGNSNDLTNASIMNETRGIANCAFYRFNNLTEVTIPSSVEYVGYLAFYETGLGKNSPPNSVVYADKWAVGYAMLGSNRLYSFVLRDDTKGIADGAFMYGRQISSIDIPSTVKSIGAGAFILCQALESVTLNEGLTRIGETAFQYCQALTSIVIPESVTQIDKNAFASDELTIYAKVTEKPNGWVDNWNAERPVIWGE